MEIGSHGDRVTGAVWRLKAASSPVELNAAPGVLVRALEQYPQNYQLAFLRRAFPAKKFSNQHKNSDITGLKVVEWWNPTRKSMDTFAQETYMAETNNTQTMRCVQQSFMRLENLLTLKALDKCQHVRETTYLA